MTRADSSWDVLIHSVAIVDGCCDAVVIEEARGVVDQIAEDLDTVG